MKIEEEGERETKNIHARSRRTKNPSSSVYPTFHRANDLLPHEPRPPVRPPQQQSEGADCTDVFPRFAGECAAFLW